jgi:hypothetical protein
MKKIFILLLLLVAIISLSRFVPHAVPEDQNRVKVYQGETYKVIRFLTATHVDNLDWIFTGTDTAETIAWLPEDHAVAFWDEKGWARQVCFGPVTVYRYEHFGPRWVWIRPCDKSFKKNISKAWYQLG